MSNASQSAELTVFYDGTCPLCTAEINHFQKVSEPGAIAFEDVSLEGAVRPGDVTRDDVLARFHVQLKDGTILSGAAAFAKMWAHAPGWRWMSRVSKIPGVLWIMERLYRMFLIMRPGLVWLLSPLLRSRCRKTGSTE